MKRREARTIYFREQLLSWHQAAPLRPLPWKINRDPYRIWLSEIILQQTRMDQGLPYYLRFVERYPDVHALAQARDDEVFRLWQGLGYYNRCKNLLTTARHISETLGGRFPDTYEDILKLKGVGNYTAAAISSFAYALPCAVVDGNVYRVLSRYCGIETPIDTGTGKREFQETADQFLYREDSAAYNQAIMDFGATVCKPVQPECGECPLSLHCEARKQNLVSLLPVKSKKTLTKTRYFLYLLLVNGARLWIRKREERDIWQNLIAPFLLEAEKPLDSEELLQQPLWKKTGLLAEPILIGEGRQKLTHQLIEARFFKVEVQDRKLRIPGGG